MMYGIDTEAMRAAIRQQQQAENDFPKQVDSGDACDCEDCITANFASEDASGSVEDVVGQIFGALASQAADEEEADYREYLTARHTAVALVGTILESVSSAAAAYTKMVDELFALEF
jgi:hypothetical protein